MVTPIQLQPVVAYGRKSLLSANPPSTEAEGSRGRRGHLSLLQYPAQSTEDRDKDKVGKRHSSRRRHQVDENENEGDQEAAAYVVTLMICFQKEKNDSTSDDVRDHQRSRRRSK